MKPRLTIVWTSTDPAGLFSRSVTWFTGSVQWKWTRSGLQGINGHSAKYNKLRRFCNSLWAWGSGARTPERWDVRYPSRPATRPTQHPANSYRVPFPGVKRPGRGVGHRPTTSAHSVHWWSYISTSHLCFHGVLLGDFYILPKYWILGFIIYNAATFLARLYNAVWRKTLL